MNFNYDHILADLNNSLPSSPIHESDKDYSALYFGAHPQKVRLFSTDMQSVILHEDTDPALGIVGRLFACPGPGCPYCLLEKKKVTYFVTPVFSIELASVKAVRIPKPLKNSPNSFLMQYANCGKKTDDLGPVLSIAKVDKQSYSVQNFKTTKFTLGDVEIAEFKAKVSRGELVITDIFPKPRLETLFDVPAIRTEYAMLGFELPKSSSATPPAEEEDDESL